MSVHAVLGAGGVGGLMAGALARAGREVTVIVRPGSGHPDVVHVESDALGEFEVRVRVGERLAAPVDHLWVAVKAGALEAAIRQAPAELVRGSVIPLLNGVDHMAPLRACYGAGRVIAGAIRVESERVAPGRIRQSGPLLAVELGGPGELVDPVARELEEAGLRVTTGESPDRVLWGKLIMLAPFSLTATASQLPLGGIADDPGWRELMLGCMREVRQVAAARGVELAEPVQMLEVAPRGMRTSMQKDAAAGRPLEVDHIAGPILRGGREHGIPTPCTERLVALIRERHG